jgi:hypothetical protein
LNTTKSKQKAMKPHPAFNSKMKFLFTVAAAASCLLPSISTRAQTFTYTNCDLVAAFRIAGGANDLVVDLGTVSKFESLPARSVTAITNLSTTQLADALPTVNGVSWSVSAALRGNPNYPQYGLQTIWITSPRPDIYTPGNIWQRASQGTLGGAASQIDAIGVNAASYGNGQPASVDNTVLGVVIPSSSSFSYTYQVGAYGNLTGNFQGNPENTTPADFDTAGLPSRSVLYRLEPDFYPHGTGVVIGFFDFKPDGTMTFTAGPPPERTTITSFTRNGNIATAWFPTINLVGYRLRYTDSAGLATPISSWSIGSALIGDGTTLFLQDTSSTANRFYTIEAYY